MLNKINWRNLGLGILYGSSISTFTLMFLLALVCGSKYLEININFFASISWLSMFFLTGITIITYMNKTIEEKW